jgi:endoglucanase
MATSKIKAVGYVFIGIAVIIMVTVLYKNNAKRHVPIVFSAKNMTGALWERYKLEYLEPTTFRALDKQRENITTSEGQSYSMLRAVWLDDHATFDSVWKWTKDNLRREDDNLFSWLFGRKPNGSYGIITEMGGVNTASDADTDIALALLFAYARWKEPHYLEDAKAIISDIWNEEVVLINGRPYLSANNIEKNYQDDVVINPSYFAPYAYRIFGTIDKEHDWATLVDTSYDVIARSIVYNLDKDESAKLPPNWIEIGRADGAIKPPTEKNLTTDYSFDALRLPWRIALDWQWNKEPRAEKILKSMEFLSREWKDNRALYSEYGHDGKALEKSELPAMYGGSIGALMAIDSVQAKEVYETKLQSLYSPDEQGWKERLGYYDDNWAWFGIALYNGLLPNLWSDITSNQ